MQIAILCDEIAPYSSQSPLARDVASLAGQFVVAGHDVVAVSPFPSEMNPAEHALARRLTPIRCEAEGATIKVGRYDGRTAGGVSTLLLEFKNTSLSGDEGRRIFADAALQAIDSLSEPVDACVVFAGLGSRFPEVAAASSSENLEDTTYRLVIGEVTEDVGHIKSGVENSQSVAVLAPAVGEAARLGLTEITGPISNGSWPMMETPVEEIHPAGVALKGSAKAALQMRLGLPVLESKPLLYVDCASVARPEELVTTVLARDVQVVIQQDPRGEADWARVRNTYRDRLGIAGTDVSQEELLQAADACIASTNERLLGESLSVGTVPIVEQHSSGRLVCIDNDMLSGAVVHVASDSPRDIEAGVLRFLAMQERTDAFQSLYSRLPRYAITWESSAKRHLEQMEMAGE